MGSLKITKENFEQEVLKSDVPVIVDFWAAWCGPCQMLGPVIEDIAADLQGAKIGKINVDEEQDLARKYGVMSIPTIIAFKDGEILKQSVGVISKEEILNLIK